MSYEDFIRRGALVQPLGKVLVVEDTIIVRGTSIILVTSSQCYFTTSLYDMANDTLQTAATKHDPSLVSLLSNLYTVDISNFSLSAVASYMPWFNILHPSHSHGRTKSSLFELGGMVLGKCFGLATEEGLYHVRVEMASLTDGLT